MGNNTDDYDVIENTDDYDELETTDDYDELADMAFSLWKIDMMIEKAGLAKE